MSAKHTPGPWVGLKPMGRWHIYEGADRDNLGPLVVTLAWAEDADARLIAAAPELLEALKLVLDLIPRAHGPTVQMARAAITKAEGKP